mmetsp:Transcript_38728/g.114811  ORF Transcript_38728/g.114811 Transcript_38728/m.114811 type:complete len:212 (-) Transcript_38728:158-793(-)
MPGLRPGRDGHGTRRPERAGRRFEGAQAAEVSGAVGVAPALEEADRGAAGQHCLPLPRGGLRVRAGGPRHHLRARQLRRRERGRGSRQARVGPARVVGAVICTSRIALGASQGAGPVGIHLYCTDRRGALRAHVAVLTQQRRGEPLPQEDGTSFRGTAAVGASSRREQRTRREEQLSVVLSASDRGEDGGRSARRRAHHAPVRQADAGHHR